MASVSVPAIVRARPPEPKATEPARAGHIELGRRRGMAVFLALLSLLMFFALGLAQPAAEKTVFVLTAPPAFHVPNLSMPVRWTSIGLAITCAVVAARLFTWRREKGVFAIFFVGIALFMWDFLMWAARGGSLNFEQLLVESLIATIPLVFGSLSGVMCERSGVINIAIEGQFLAGAFLAAMIGSYTGDLWLGLLSGAAAGALFGALLAFLALRYRADQIIIGVVIVALCTGLTSFLTLQVLSPYQSSLNSANTFRVWAIPLLSKIPIVGPLLFNQNLFVYLAAILVVTVHVALFKTRWGLRVRSVGEFPRASETVGLRVLRTRYINVILGGVIAGIGGASFTIGSNGVFAAGMTGGLGFVALAAMIFGRWRPFGALAAALLFGFAQSLESFLQLFNVGIPGTAASPFLSMTPYVITIVVVSGLVGRVRPPAADGQPYKRD